MSEERRTERSQKSPSRGSGSDRSRSDKPRSDKPRSDKPRSDKPRSDKPRSDRPANSSSGYSSSGSGTGARDGARRDSRGSHDSRSRTSERPTTYKRDEDSDRPERGPWLDESIVFEDLDKSVRFELHTLPETLQEKVGRYLLAAENAVADDDLKSALAYVRYAKKIAGRVSVVRESAGVIEYLAGEYAAALNEFRAVRRMTGSNDFVAMMADCERGLGRPERAIEFLKSVPMDKLSQETQVEALIVAAGARADMGQVDAGLILLNIPALKSLPAGDLRARLQEAYSNLLEQAGKLDQAQIWRAKALKSDINGVTSFSRNDEDDEVSIEMLGEVD